MRTRAVRIIALAACLAASLPSLLADQPLPPSKLFDGSPNVFVVNGYSTSRQWPQILQRKLDRYFDGERVIEVRSAIKGSTPIARWIDVDTGERLASWNEIVRPALQRADDRPTVVLAQQSLQWAFGDRFEGIRGPEDRERIERGADVLQRYAEALLEDGADQVFLAMHIYKHDQEPVIGNERLALTELVKREIPNVYAGPDVWQATKAEYPNAFARDRRHPNEIGAEIMAQRWFEALLRHDGQDVPEWSRKELAEATQPQREPANGETSAKAQDERIDWNKARELRRRMLAGEKLSEEEQEYLERARQLRRNPARAAQGGAQRKPTSSAGLVPLTDMTAEQRYKGEDGGLYGDGSNEPPKAHLEAALREARRIRPLDAQGQSAENGRIVLISNGMSNTTQEFQAFVRLANDDPNKSPYVVIVDGAQGGMEASRWATRPMGGA